MGELHRSSSRKEACSKPRRRPPKGISPPKSQPNSDGLLTTCGNLPATLPVMYLSNKVALVTGATSGSGLGIARDNVGFTFLQLLMQLPLVLFLLQALAFTLRYHAPVAP